MTPYTKEKYYLAIMSIGQSAKPPANRLADAWIFHLMHAQREANSDEIVDVLEQLAEAFSEVENPEIGSAHASANEWDDEKVRRVAELFAAISLKSED